MFVFLFAQKLDCVPVVGGAGLGEQMVFPAFIQSAYVFMAQGTSIRLGRRLLRLALAEGLMGLHFVLVEGLFAGLAGLEVGFFHAFLEQVGVDHGHLYDLSAPLAVSQHQALT